MFSVPARTSRLRALEFSADRIALVILAVIALIAGITFRDYGLGWDDFSQSQYGELLLKFYGSGFADRRALSFVNLYKYGGAFDMAAALAAKLLPFGLFETRRLIGAAVGILGLIVTWRIGRRLSGPLAGLCALALLAACPLYYGHMFINSKDAPFAVAMAVLLLGFVRAIDEYPRASAWTMVLTGVGIGLAFGSRILALLAGPYLLAALVLLFTEEARSDGFGAAAKRLGRFMRSMLPALLIGYLIMGLLWPWSIISPLNPIRAAIYFDKFFETPWRELYEGKLIQVPNMPATYLPHLFALKLPLLMLILALAGAVGALIVCLRRRLPAPQRAKLLMISVAALLPIATAMVTRPALYNGIRQFVFVVPPFAVLGGLAAAWALAQAQRHSRLAFGAAAAVLLAGLALPIAGMARLHPYEYVYFNTLAGNVRGAHGNYMLDYWGLAFKQAADALRAYVATAHEKPGRRWVVAICGPQSAAEAELGPKFETTFDTKKADFVMSLGTFYCRHLQAPLLAEIKREGISFARVYDLRGRPTPKLLTQPPP